MKSQQTSQTRLGSCFSGDRPLRVLHLVETLEVGGTEGQAAQTALHQRSIGYQVTVGCLRAQGPLFKLLQGAGIPIAEFRKEKKLFSIQGIRQLLCLAVFLRRNRFDVLHAHDLMSNLLGVPAARLAGTPIVLSSRRYEDLEWWSGKLRNWVAAAMYKLSTYVVVNSDSVCDLLVSREGIRRDKIRVLHNGIDIDQFGKARASKATALSAIRKHSMLVAVVANMYSPVKGHATLVTAASEVCRHFPDVGFVLIGDGDERSKLEHEVKAAGLEESFLFLGSRRDVPELLACCDISVLPSESEGFPNAILEAMAARLAVVATSVGGIPEIVENEVTGLLVVPRNSAALSTAILRLLKDQELRSRLADAGHRRVAECFSFDRLVSSLGALYKGVPESLPTTWQQRQSLQTLAVNTRFVHQPHE
jgi:glycosyltransferase involved in cell wall biosynthesis